MTVEAPLHVVVTCWPPRLPSIEPRPVLDGDCCTAAPGLAFIAAVRLTRPVPWPFAVKFAIGDAVLFSAAFTWSGVHVGCACNSSATRPDVTAVASLVPEPRMYDGVYSAFGKVCSIVEPYERCAMMKRPG